MFERQPLPVVVFIGAVVGFAVMATLFAVLSDVPHLLLLEREHADAAGSVIRSIPNSHGQVEIEYRVAGVTYRRAFTTYGMLPPIVVGQTLRVYYYPRDPEVAFTAPPEEVFAEERAGWVALSFLGAFCGGLLTYKSVRPLQNKTFRYLSANGPKLLSAGISIGVVASAVFSAFFGTLTSVRIAGGILALSGCGILLNLAWRRKLTWSEVFRTRQFWLAVALGTVANILEFQS